MLLLILTTSCMCFAVNEFFEIFSVQQPSGEDESYSAENLRRIARSLSGTVIGSRPQNFGLSRSCVSHMHAHTHFPSLSCSPAARKHTSCVYVCVNACHHHHHLPPLLINILLPPCVHTMQLQPGSDSFPHSDDWQLFTGSLVMIVVLY